MSITTNGAQNLMASEEAFKQLMTLHENLLDSMTAINEHIGYHFTQPLLKAKAEYLNLINKILNTPGELREQIIKTAYPNTPKADAQIQDHPNY